MPSYSKNEVVLVRYPFSDLTSTKVRPAVIVNAHNRLKTYLSSRLPAKRQAYWRRLLFADWKGRLNVETAAKRGVFTIHERLVLRGVGRLGTGDAKKLDASLREWLGLH